MTPVWKIRRELRRLGQQASAAHEAIWEPLVQRRHDKLVREGLPTFDGAITLGPKVAIFLVFQPRMLPQTIVETCQFLVDNGYSPLVVANGSLPEASRTRLLPHVWKILGRPNLGYDFGGYRDGINQLRLWKVEPSKLLILNDSIWFPISRDCQLLRQMEDAGADVVGTVLRQKDKVSFLESYLYLIDDRVLKNSAIQEFWKSLKLTANKYKVIRRGERGHSVALGDAGFHLHPMFSSKDFLARLRSQDQVFLEKTLRYSVAETVGLSGQRDALLNAHKDEAWRTAVFDHVERVLQNAQFYSAFPFAAVRLLNYPILKRSGDMVSVLWRKAYLAAVTAGDLEAPTPSVFAELQSLVALKAKT
jgi:Rhamnan synthesis protein F